MDYLLMAVAITFGAVNSIVLRIFKNRTFTTPGDVFFFNGGVSAVWVLVMSLWFIIGGGSISTGSVAYGAVYAVILCLFFYLKTEALASGPIALTTLISSAAFIIPTLYGVVAYAEIVNSVQAIGIILITISLFMCINPKNSHEKLTAKWFVYCFAFFLVGGLLGIFYKIFGKSEFSADINSMMLSASFISAILYFAFGAILNTARKYPLPKIHMQSLIFILASGIAGCIYIRLNISLSAVIPSPIFFPVSNGALVLISTAAGYAFFKEKLKAVQILGMLLGIISIVIIGCSNIILGLL